MNKSPLTTALIAIQAVIAVWLIWLCFSFVTNAQQLRTLQVKMNFINYRQAAMNSLAKDVVDYSQKNHEIDPILEKFNLKQKGAAAPAKPPGK